MPTYRVQLRDGRTVRIEAASPQAADAAAGEYMRANPRKGIRGQEGYAKARERLGEEAKFAAKSPMRGDFTRRVAGSTGAADEVAGGIMFARQGVENLFRRATGQPVETSAQQAYMAGQDAEREWQERYAREHPTGNVFATGLGIMASGRPTGAATIANPFQAGKAAAIQNLPFAFARQQGNFVERLPGTATETAMAFGTGAALTAGGNAVARAGAKARAKPPTAARRLSQQGVNLTPGQMMGGAAQRAEDALTSVPIVGDSIRDARIRGLDTFNRAALDRTLAPVGQALPPDAAMGRGAVAAAEQKISDAYTAALQGVQVPPPDRQFSADVQAAMFSRQLPDDAQQEVNAVLQNSLVSRLNGGPIDGDTWKAIDAELRAARDAADAASNTKPSMRFAAQTLGDIRKAWQAMLERSNPQAMQGVRAADEATANLARIRQASQYAGTAARGGVFSPSDLNRAVLAGDSSAGNRAYTKGEALMQDLTDPAMEVLPSTVPDSGTPIRSVLTALAGLGGGAAGGAALGIGAAPEAMATIGGATVAASGLYSKPAQDALNAIYRAKTPGAARSALGRLGQLAARDPGLVPVFEEAARALGVPLPSSSRQQGPQGRLPAPTTP